MVGILKLVYIAIIYVSFFLVVCEGESKLILFFFFYLRHNISLIFGNISLSLFYISGKCVTADDCQAKQHMPTGYHFICLNNRCVLVYYN